MRRYTTADAITSLCPEATFEMLFDDYDNLIWNSPDIPVPSKESVQAELSRLHAVSLSLSYRSSRIAEYPAITEQLDILFHHGYDVWKTTIQEIKDKYPKPE
jgi:hypothetical protein